MDKPQKPYVKPEFTIYPTGSPMHNKIMAALEAEEKKNRPIVKHPI